MTTGALTSWPPAEPEHPASATFEEPRNPYGQRPAGSTRFVEPP